MNTKPYPDPPSAPCAKSAPQERVAAETDGASAVDGVDPQASASPVFRSHLKYIDIPPDLLAEMKARPLARMPTSELYSTRRFEVPSKGETPALAHETKAAASPVPASLVLEGPAEGEEPSPAPAQPLPLQVPRPKASLRIGAATLICGLLLGGYWVATDREIGRAEDDASHPVDAVALPAPPPGGPDEEAKSATEPARSVVAGDAREPAAAEALPLERSSRAFGEGTSKPRASEPSPAEDSEAASMPRRSGERSTEGEPKASSPKKPKKWFDLE